MGNSLRKAVALILLAGVLLSLLLIAANAQSVVYSDWSSWSTTKVTATWVIRYKFTQAGENTYSVSTRGPAWSDAKIFTTTVK